MENNQLRNTVADLQDRTSVLHTIMDNADAAVFMMDHQQHCIYMNPAAERLTGFTLEEVQGRPLHDLIHHMKPDGSHYPLEECPIDRALPERAHMKGEDVFVRKDGTFYNVSFVASPIVRDGTPVGTVIEVQDITDRKREEQELLRTQAIWETFNRSADTLIYVKDREGKMLDANRATLELIGHDDGSIKQTYTDFNGRSSGADLVAANDRKVMESGGTLTFEEVMVINGDPHTYYSTKTALKDTHGEVVGLVGVSFDITERRRYEEMLLDMDIRKDQFLATLAHELRNPLAPLKNGIEMLGFVQEDLQLLESARQMMDRQLTHLMRLVDDLMDMSRITQGKVELQLRDLDLCEVLEDPVQTAKEHAAEKTQGVNVRMPEHPVMVAGDRTRLNQVVGNVLNNAIRYTPHNGRIDVEVTVDEGTVTVQVSDNGIGMRAEQIQQAFDVFTQLDHGEEVRAGGGLGIGLALVRQITEMHGGSVSAHSDGLGKGSTFMIRLPLLKHATVRYNGGVMSTRIPTSEKRKRILVVDDMKDVARSTGLLLERLGHEVRVCHDGQEALTMAESFRPDVIFMDLGMPKMSGFSACRLIRGHDWGRDMRIIAVTGWGQTDDKLRSSGAGFDDHLVKPASLKELQEKIEAEQQQH